MFWRETPARDNRAAGSSRLVSIDITGFNERAVPTPTDASDPAWSPLLPDSNSAGNSIASGKSGMRCGRSHTGFLTRLVTTG